MVGSIYFYDEDGHYQLTTYCNKRLAKYDMVKNAILIPAKGIKIQTNSDDDDDDENENSNSKYSKSKPQYMTFKKACNEEPSLFDLRRYSKYAPLLYFLIDACKNDKIQA